jgi:hypothetical protein
MASELDRFTRQRRLPEVGAAGQARIAAAEIELSSSDGAMEELAYLCRAGVERVSVSSNVEPRPFAHEGAFRFAESRAVAAGAWRALGELRRILEVEPA